MMLDVDRFKNFNDSFGHATGDKVLRAIGGIIKNSFKGMDVAGRTGGDEFMVLLRDIEKVEYASLLAERIEKEVNQLVFHADSRISVSLSIGISVFPDHGQNFETLYNAADKALYYVKNHGRASWKVYTPEMEKT